MPNLSFITPSKPKPNLNRIPKKIISGIKTQLTKEICHQITFSYGDELTLDFGEMSAYNHPKLAHLCKGSWQLGTRATQWNLRQNNVVLISSAQLIDSKDQIREEMLQKLQNKKLDDFVIDASMRLTLVFEDNYQFILEPDLEDDSGLAHWELWMPTEEVLTVGPGYLWECKSIHTCYQ
jgi:hypothetical protein